MSRDVLKGSTNVIQYVVIRDSVTGQKETGFDVTTLEFQYTREGAEPSVKQSVTALAATNSDHADNKAIEIDATNSPGLCRVDFPDAAFAAGVDSVILSVTGSGFDISPKEVPLVSYNPNDAVRLGLTALPNANVGAAGGLLKTDLGRDYDTDLKSAAFAGGMVWVDAAGTASTTWPYGTAPYPTNTIARGKTIADANSITQLRIKGLQTLAAAMEGYNFIGGLYLDATEMIDLGGYSVEHSSFRDLVITGICGNAALIGDQTTYTDCYLYAVTNIHGWVNGGRTEGACSIRDTGYATLANVLFGSAVACTLTIQAPTQCDIENMSGELTLAGMDGGVCTISMARGSILTIDNTCTGGTLTITGAGTVTDNSNGTTVTVAVNEADVVQIGSDAQSMTDLKDLVDTGYDPATNKIQGVVLVDTTTTNTDMVSAATIATTVMAKVVDGTLDVTEALKVILALAPAKQTDVAGSVYTFKDQAGATKVTITYGASSSTVVIA